jgi:hypothetical protein
MKNKNYMAGSILFLAMAACAIPGLSQSAAPAFDPNTIPTMVVLTANALASQTAAALPPGTPTPASIPTETATAAPIISLSGTSLLLRDDQTTLFTDHKAGIELVVLDGWLAVRINEQEYFDAWLLPEISDLAFQKSLTSIKNLNPNESRLFAFDIQEGHHSPGSPVTNINLLWQENLELSLDNKKDLQEIANANSKVIPNLVILTKDISATSSGIPIGVITSKVSGTTTGGVKVIVYYKQIFLKARTGMLTITLTTPEELKEIVFPAFDAMIESMTLVKE